MSEKTMQDIALNSDREQPQIIPPPRRETQMDARLIAVIMRLSEDMAAMEKALTQTRKLLEEVLKEKDEGNGKKRPRYLAQQQPRWSGTAPWRTTPRENDEEQ